MRLAGYQPQYFPRLHYLNRVLSSDVFEVSDYVQYVRKHAFPQADGTMKRGVSYQSHTPIKLSQGEFLLAIPTHDNLSPINNTKIDYSQDWMGKHLKSIEVGYSKAPHFKIFYSEIEQLLSDRYDNLSDLTFKSVLWAITRLITKDQVEIKNLSVEYINGILNKTEHPFRLKKIFLASKSPVPAPKKDEANDWNIKLCKYADADEYFYGGTSHAAYIDTEKFKKAGIKTILQNWKCKEYNQQYAKAGFVPNISAIDLILNEELVVSQKIIS